MLGDRPDQLFVEARRGLLDALEALSAHINDLVLVGAQAIYLHTEDVVTGVALFTKDADVALVPPLATTPDIDHAMRSAGFAPGKQPGIWLDEGRQVDLLVPESLANPRGSRAARLDGHGLQTARKVAGMEGAAVDSDTRTIRSLDAGDRRTARIRVAGPGALLVSKAYKLEEREAESEQDRLNAKDAFDMYRLLRLPTAGLAERFEVLFGNDISRDAAAHALKALSRLFSTPDALGSSLAGRYVQGVGNPDEVRRAASALANDLVRSVRIRE